MSKELLRMEVEGWISANVSTNKFSKLFKRMFQWITDIPGHPSICLSNQENGEKKEIYVFKSKGGKESWGHDGWPPRKVKISIMVEEVQEGETR